MKEQYDPSSEIYNEARKQAVTKPEKKKRKFKYSYIIPIVILILVLIAIILNYIKEEEKIQTTFNMNDFQAKFSFNDYYNNPIKDEYLNRDLYIIDTISQIEHKNEKTGFNFESSGTYTNMDNDFPYLYFDVAFDGNLTDEYKIGDKVKITVEITTPGFYYEYNYKKIEHFD